MTHAGPISREVPSEGLDFIGSSGSESTPKVCKIMAFMAVILGLGLLFYVLLGFR